MKVDELVGYKNKPEYKAFASEPATDPKLKSWERDGAEVSKMETIMTKLDNLGYKQYSLGSGFYAKVYARPQDDFVIKIFRQDPGYSRFIKYVFDHRNNPYVPKLKGKIIKLPNNYSLVRVEKLKRIDVDLFNGILFAANNPHDKPLIQSINQQYPGLLDFIAELKDMVKNSGNTIAFDLHRSNMMMRGETPVIIDPFAEPTLD